MKIAIYSRTGNSRQEEGVVQLISKLTGKAEILLYKPVYEAISKPYRLQLQPHELFEDAAALPSDVLCLISVGGDGTLLEAASLVIDNGIPLIGVSTGRLSFLIAMTFDKLDVALDCILHKKYEIEHRQLLHVQGLPCGDRFVLNEVCVQKRGSAIAEIDVHINGDFLSTYWADGLIVSTPTGSTAYSLSAGGPIISPQATCFAIAPIAPHNLTMRPIIVPSDSHLTLDVRTRSGFVTVGVDGKEYKMAVPTKLTVKKAKQQVSIMRLHNTSFYQTLREKLLWGMDARSR